MPFRLVFTEVNKLHRYIVILGNILNLVTMLIQYTVFDVGFLVPECFYEWVLLQFLHNSFHVGVSQIIPKLILHTIINL